MYRSQEKISAGGIVLLLLILLNTVLLEKSFVTSSEWYKVTYVTFPLLLLAIFVNRKN